MATAEKVFTNAVPAAIPKHSRMRNCTLPGRWRNWDNARRRNSLIAAVRQWRQFLLTGI